MRASEGSAGTRVPVRGEDLGGLREKALAAMPAPWFADPWDQHPREGWRVCSEPRQHEFDAAPDEGPWPHFEVAMHVLVEDAAFIAAANPAVVIALCDELARLRAALERVRELCFDEDGNPTGWSVTVNMVRAALDGTEADGA